MANILPVVTGLKKPTAIEWIKLRENREMKKKQKMRGKERQKIIGKNHYSQGLNFGVRTRRQNQRNWFTVVQ